MSLYIPTDWTGALRDVALFNKREQGIDNLFKKRAYWNAGSGYSVAGDSNWHTAKFGTATTRKFYDTDNTAVASCITQESGHDTSILKPSWATFGIVSATIIPSDWDFIKFEAYVDIGGSNIIRGYTNITQKKTIHLRGITTAGAVTVVISAQSGSPVGYGATVSAFWY